MHLKRTAIAATLISLSASLLVLASAADSAASGAAGNRHRLIVVDKEATHISGTVRSRLCTASPNCLNGKDGIDVVVLTSGRAPTNVTSAIVQSDDNCMPDAYGISHCTNA